MRTYTAVLFTNADGSHTARVPALSREGRECQAQGRTRAEALEKAAEAAAGLLADDARAGRPMLRQEWPPVRTVHVLDPRRGGTIPYVVCVERDAESRYRVTPVLFPELQGTSASVEEALERVGPLIFQHLTLLVSQGKGFPVQDDPQAYMISVREPDL